MRWSAHVKPGFLGVVFLSRVDLADGVRCRYGVGIASTGIFRRRVARELAAER